MSEKTQLREVTALVRDEQGLCNYVQIWTRGRGHAAREVYTQPAPFGKRLEATGETTTVRGWGALDGRRRVYGDGRGYEVIL